MAAERIEGIYLALEGTTGILNNLQLRRELTFDTTKAKLIYKDINGNLHEIGSGSGSFDITDNTIPMALSGGLVDSVIKQDNNKIIIGENPSSTIDNLNVVTSGVNNYLAVETLSDDFVGIRISKSESGGSSNCNWYMDVTDGSKSLAFREGSALQMYITPEGLLTLGSLYCVNKAIFTGPVIYSAVTSAGNGSQNSGSPTSIDVTNKRIVILNPSTDDYHYYVLTGGETAQFITIFNISSYNSIYINSKVLFGGSNINGYYYTSWRL